jgi:Phosphotransferase enzyme family
MSQVVETPEAGTNEGLLRSTVELLLARAAGHPVRVRGLERRPSPFATLFPAEVLSLSLAGGGQLSLFVKHLGPEEADNPDKRCRDREVRVYEGLLAGHDLPVPRYYGSALNEATGRRGVFLEYVDDWSLKYQSLEHWQTAARRLARLHAHFAARAGELAACQFLLRLDAGYLHTWARRALATVRELYPESAAGLEGVVRESGRVAGVLGRQPVTLVHNDLAPKNTLADRTKDPARICFVDWELAGVGCGLLDLVHLKYGLGPEDDRRMCAAYCGELAGTGLVPADPRELDAVLAACELHKTLYRLASCRPWGLPADRVAGWVDDACGFLVRVGGAAR